MYSYVRKFRSYRMWGIAQFEDRIMVFMDIQSWVLQVEKKSKTPSPLSNWRWRKIFDYFIDIFWKIGIKNHFCSCRASKNRAIPNSCSWNSSVLGILIDNICNNDCSGTNCNWLTKQSDKDDGNLPIFIRDPAHVQFSSSLFDPHVGCSWSYY